MLIIQVQVQVKPEFMEAFKKETRENASRSIKEPGVARFDVSQAAKNPCRFLLTEVYRDEAAPAAHKETAHYQKWRQAVEPMMAAARQSVKYRNVFPTDQQWSQHAF